MYYRKLVEVRISGSSPKVLIQQPKVDFRNLHLTNSQVICMQVICGPHLEEHHLAVAQSLNCVRLCEPMDCSTSGFPVFHSLSEFAQTHIHWVSDAIQTSHPLSPSSPLAFNHSQHQGLFQWVTSWHQVAKVLEFQLQLQHQSFQWTPRTGLL